MDARTQDGTAADVGLGAFARRPRPDPRIARFVAEALDGARTVLDVGAGAHSHEGAAGAMRAVAGAGPACARRPALLARAVDAVAGDLPYADGEFDASMTLFDVHQWSDVAAGLREMRRVTRGPVVVLARAPELVRDFWLDAYAPEVLETEARRHPPVRDLTAALGGTGRVRAVPIPLDCTDGFDEAYYGRPEMLLDPAARQACSAWSFVGDEVREHFDRTLRHDLASGAWDRRFGRLRTEPVYEGSLVLVRATP
ncbi:MAG TPA: SAM-dependent methyltransferase [Streptomyces sp.]|nr:SAM-dependent methyltransferase [Streptomyces sp.]